MITSSYGNFAPAAVVRHWPATIGVTATLLIGLPLKSMRPTTESSCRLASASRTAFLSFGLVAFFSAAMPTSNSAWP